VGAYPKLPKENPLGFFGIRTRVSEPWMPTDKWCTQNRRWIAWFDVHLYTLHNEWPRTERNTNSKFNTIYAHKITLQLQRVIHRIQLTTATH